MMRTLEEVMEPEKVTRDSRVEDPFGAAGGVAGSLVTRLRLDGFLDPRAFQAYRQRDFVTAIRPVANKLFGEIMAEYELLMASGMSGINRDRPSISTITAAFLELVVVMASLAPFTSHDAALNFLRQPYSHTIRALALDQDRSHMTLRWDIANILVPSIE